MVAVTLENIGKSFGKTKVIQGIDLAIESGEFIVLVGSSGSGKSTLLRMIAGLEAPSEGRIHIGERDVTDLEPAKRNVSMVFQSYALYPHMTVRQNIGFGLKLAKTDKAQAEAAVIRVAEILEIGELLDRKPGQLSGGQRQRVAIARAIVREPEVFLFDEPLSNLDAGLRARTRMEIKALHRSLSATMIYVTHDQVEAMSLADRMVILHNGKIAQAGPPAEIYRRPANLYVAGFLGSPPMNFLAPGLLAGDFGVAETVGIRPEDVSIGVGDISGEVTMVEELGEARIVHLRLANGTDIAVRDTSADEPASGSTLSLHMPREKLHLFDREGQRIAN